ncbi:MAG: beta-ketoacyl-[acyl-carrier-protein] synthase II, partial [Deltaproteobacteria bacterium]|nr:beta-ketoacyl-[acyl-carrier-protein] synthase II [Deltaproteobacteria bacterium]
MRTEHPKRVAVTGLGLVTPIGNDVEQSWANITGGKSGVGQITRFDAQGLKTTIAAEVKGFNAEEYLDRKNVRRYELFIQYAVAAAKQAVKDSAIDLSKILAGCSLGCGLGGLKTMEDNHA